jgi:predicted transposase YbfD/YdcC
MARKKGIAPAHVKRKHFVHPGHDLPMIAILEKVEDPRRPSIFFQYPLTSILFMTLIAVMCGATDWPKVIAISQGLSEWLAKYVDMSAGVPCERTFKNLMNALKPEALEQVLLELSSRIRKKSSQEVISFDGQTARGTSDRRVNLSGIHLVSAWSSENGICLGQLKVDDKSNEITAVPELMELLDLKGAIITGDALITQKAIAAKAIKVGGDYLLPVKGNHPALLKDIELAFEGLMRDQELARSHWERAVAKAREQRDEAKLKGLLTKGVSLCGAHYWQEEPEKSHGRIETRKCLAIPVGTMPSATEWQGLATLVRMDRERILGDRVTNETTYYISSLGAKMVALIGEAARDHWGVENGLHWRLDVVFRQDKSRYRDRVGARNLAAIRKIVLNALSKETSFKGGMATKQCVAAVNPTYRDKLVKNLF